jgi:hypothetical protein
LLPEKPVVFEVPFTINSDKDREANAFDAWFATVTSGFSNGGVYSATLPLYQKLDWWRYATSSDLPLQLPFTTQNSSFIITGFKSAVASILQWWQGDRENKYGVPVLPYEQQLPIYIEGEGVIFSCVGERIEWPTEILEKQRENRERRDGEQKRIAEEKRREREGGE